MCCKCECENCGFKFEGIAPCPTCGSEKVIYHLVLEDHFEIHDGTEIKNNKKVGKRKRSAFEAFYGDEKKCSSGEWIQKERVIDRENDLYHEKVVDPQTGIVIHECDEKLSEHLGHGSDKKDESK